MAEPRPYRCKKHGLIDPKVFVYPDGRVLRNCPTCTAETKKRWVANNRDKHRANTLAYFYRNKDKSRQNKRAWNARNPEKHTQYEKNRRAGIYNAPVRDFQLSEWYELLEEYSHTCIYCGATDRKLTQDHDVPLSRGGSHTKSNIVPACLSCNSRKGIFTKEEFVERIAQSV